MDEKRRTNVHTHTYIGKKGERVYNGEKILKPRSIRLGNVNFSSVENGRRRKKERKRWGKTFTFVNLKYAKQMREGRRGNQRN
jgi:hypothetical protein